MKKIFALPLFAALPFMLTAKDASWTGPYAGVTLSRSDYQATFSDVSYYWEMQDNTTSKQGLNGGIQVGYDYQMGNTVIGVELDHTFASNQKVQDYDYSASYSSDMHRTDAYKGLTTLRAKAGLAVGNTLLYITGGLGKGSFQHTLSYDWNSGSNSYPRFANSSTGLVTGAGLEHRLGNNLSMRMEFLNFKSGQRTVTNNNGYDQVVTDEVRSFRIGASYRF